MGTAIVQDGLIHRAFDTSHVELRRDGVVEGLMVPWGVPADIVELHQGQLVQYREEFARGAFGDPGEAFRRVGLHFTHSEVMGNVMGYGVAYHDSAEGAVGQWQLYKADREKAEELLTTTHTGLSVTAYPQHQDGDPLAGGTVVRTRALLKYVAATDDPAYTDARVLVLRSQQQHLEEQAAELQRQRTEHVDLLKYLHGRGRPLNDAQRAFLARERVTLPATGTT